MTIRELGLEKVRCKNEFHWTLFAIKFSLLSYYDDFWEKQIKYIAKKISIENKNEIYTMTCEEFETVNDKRVNTMDLNNPKKIIYKLIYKSQNFNFLSEYIVNLKIFFGIKESHLENENNHVYVENKNFLHHAHRDKNIDMRIEYKIEFFPMKNQYYNFLL